MEPCVHRLNGGGAVDMELLLTVPAGMSSYVSASNILFIVLLLSFQLIAHWYLQCGKAFSHRISLTALLYQCILANTCFTHEKLHFYSDLLNGNALKWMTHLGFSTLIPPLTKKTLDSALASQSALRLHLHSRYIWSFGFFMVFYLHIFCLLSRFAWSSTILDLPVCAALYPSNDPGVVTRSQDHLLANIFIFFVILAHFKPYFSLKNYLAHFVVFSAILFPIWIFVQHGSIPEVFIGLLEVALILLEYPGLNELLLPVVKQERFAYLISNGFPDLFALPLLNDSDDLMMDSGDVPSSPSTDPTNGAAANLQDQIIHARQNLHTSPLFLNEITGKVPSTLAFIAFLWKYFRYSSVIITLSSKLIYCASKYPAFFIAHSIVLFYGFTNLYRLYYRSNELAFFWRVLDKLQRQLVKKFLASFRLYIH